MYIPGSGQLPRFNWIYSKCDSGQLIAIGYLQVRPSPDDLPRARRHIHGNAKVANQTVVIAARTNFGVGSAAANGRRHAGANDVIRPKYNPNVTLPLYAEAVRKVAKSGATIMLFTVLEDSGSEGRLAETWKIRFRDFNNNVRAIAEEVGAILCDANEEPSFKDPRFLAFDRLHLNPMGHDRVAQAVQETLGLPFDPSWRRPLAAAEPTPKFVRAAITTVWFATFAYRFGIQWQSHIGVVLGANNIICTSVK